MSATELRPEARDRDQYLGGSDMATVLKISPYQTPYQLWLRFCEPEKVPPISPEQAERFWLGGALEATLADRFTEVTGIKLRRQNESSFSKELDFLRINIDRKVEGKDELWEGKTVDHHVFTEDWGDAGSDQIPPYYLAQPQVYMRVKGWRFAHVSALVGGAKVVNYYMEADKPFQDLLLEKAVKFWELVQTRVPPKPQTTEDLALMYGADQDKGVLLCDGTMLNLIEQIAARKEAAKEEEKKIKALELALGELVGAHSAVELEQLPGVALATRKWGHTTQFDKKQLEVDDKATYRRYSKKVPQCRTRIIGLPEHLKGLEL